MENTGTHILSLSNREKLNVTDVNDVDSFNEEEIVAVCSCGQLNIKGDMLHIEELNLETGILVVSGRICSLTYTEKYTSTSLLKRLFGG